MHLSNYSINKHSEVYKESDNIFEPNEAHKRTITSLFAELVQKGIDIEKIKENIKQTCSRTLQVYGPIFEHHVNMASNSKNIEGKFF